MWSIDMKGDVDDVEGTLSLSEGGSLLLTDHCTLETYVKRLSAADIESLQVALAQCRKTPGEEAIS